MAEEFLADDPSAIILAVLPVGHVFDKPLPITLAKLVGALLGATIVAIFGGGIA